jgi:hypothetical protein
MGEMDQPGVREKVHRPAGIREIANHLSFSA